MTISAIKDYFSGFGEVEFVRVPDLIYCPISRMPNRCCGLVQFNLPEAAAWAILQSTHLISNCRVESTPAHIQLQVYTAPDQDSDKHILNALNDDCMRVIFKHLNLIDSTTAADVCVQRTCQNRIQSKILRIANKMLRKLCYREQCCEISEH